MPAFSWTPSYSSNVTRKPRVLKAQFGDGYSQRTTEGINSQPQVWNLTWNVTPAVAALISAYLDATLGTTAFDWTTPDGDALSFVCEEGYTKAYQDYGTTVVTATFSQDFSP